MSGADDVLLGRAELERALTALGERLPAGVSIQGCGAATSSTGTASRP